MSAISVALLNTDYCHKYYMLSMVDMFCCTKVSYQKGLVSSSNVCISRNDAVRVAQEQKAEFLFFVDSDISCPPFTLDRLYSIAVDRNCDMIGCAYPTQSPPNEILVQTTKNVVTGIEEVEALPTGLCLIRMSVFDKLEEPYFIYEKARNNSGHYNVSTEDFPFCHKIKKLGMSVWIDAELSTLVAHWCGKIGVRWKAVGTPICEFLWQPVGYELVDPAIKFNGLGNKRGFTQ